VMAVTERILIAQNVGVSFRDAAAESLLRDALLPH
jgi:hypothetical protein